MADEKQAGSNTAVERTRDHDRVQMLSLRADGTPDQYDPEFIGDKDLTLEATKEQFRQQAVSVRDTELRQPYPATAEETEEDPTIAELKAAHEEAVGAADSAAEAAVEGLFRDTSEVETTNKPAGASPTDSKAGTPEDPALQPDSDENR